MFSANDRGMQVTRKTYIDNFTVLVVERASMCELLSALSMSMVLELDDGRVASLAGESEDLLRQGCSVKEN